MDADEFCGQIILAGMHRVNRFAYFITEEEWKDENEQYIWYKIGDDED